MRRPTPWLLAVLIGAVIGVVFAAISTYDFVQHLDRQVHNLHCSFIPGAGHGGGESGCQVAMMSPYSSVLRTRVWGGVPIALGALAVFAFLLFYTADLLVTRRKDDVRATGFLALATALPAATSLIMLIISLSQLGTTCKLCVCIYVASALCLAGGVGAWRRAVRGSGGDVGVAKGDELGFAKRGSAAEWPRGGDASGARLVAVAPRGTSIGANPFTPSRSPFGSRGRFLATMFGVGVAFVIVPVALYLALAPDHARFIGSCEALAHPDDTYKIMVPMEHGTPGGLPTVEVLDPLCPSCRAFEQRLAASGLDDQLARRAVLFPLDNACNWMVTEATHPGACAVSEAVLCAGDAAPDVIAWAFAQQEHIRSATRADAGAAARMAKQAFPAIASCVGSPDARSRLNKSMRWIVANNIRVLTPQIYVDNVKLCDEDVDLGLEFTLSRMIERAKAGTLTPMTAEKPAGGAR